MKRGTFFARAREYVFRPSRPPHTQETIMVGDGKGGPSPFIDSDIRPIEAAIVDTISNLASLVLIESDLEAIKYPDRTKSRRAWLKEIAWHACIDGVFAIIVVKYAGEDNEYLVFSDSLKPTRIRRNAYNKYEYSRNDQFISVAEKDVLQFQYRYQTYENIVTLRKAEDAFWARYERIGSNTGFMSRKESTGRGGFQPKEIAKEVDNEFMRRLREAHTARLPDGQEWTDLDKSQEDIEKAFEALVRSWCFNYKLPTSLINLDLPSHAAVNIGASYGHFIRQCLKPMLGDVFDALSIRTGTEIKLNYREVEKGSALETADAVMKIAQTGVYTINEIRTIEGMPKRDDGDDYPNVAGAPESKSNQGTDGGT